jgi:hypothetical protein
MRLMKISHLPYSGRRFAGVGVFWNPQPARRGVPARRGSWVAPLLLVLAWALCAGSFPCHAQDASGARKFTIDAGGGVAPLFGNYASGLKTGYHLRGGVGVALYRSETEYDDKGSAIPGNRWSIYLTATFLFNQSGFEPGVVVGTAASNPQTPGLLSATSGRTKFFSATLGPTFRYAIKGRVQPYFFAGYGWMRREAQLTGESIQGPVYQPSSPVVGETGGSSGAFAAGAGIDIGPYWSVGGMKFFAEIRVLHGLGINSGTTLAPGGGIRF